MARRTSDDFASDDDSAPEMELDATRIDGVKIGLEEADDKGDIAFHQIVTDVFLIGRDPECNLVLRGDSKVSRKHASIHRTLTSFKVMDEGSSNGTMVNGARITEPVTLKFGDVVVVGTHTFTFARRT